MVSTQAEFEIHPNQIKQPHEYNSKKTRKRGTAVPNFIAKGPGQRLRHEKN